MARAETSINTEQATHRNFEEISEKKKLFEDQKENYNVMKRNCARPPIMKDMWAEIIKMKSGKATRPRQYISVTFRNT